eukprot:4237145-Amphidinium_carterae.1
MPPLHSVPLQWARGYSKSTAEQYHQSYLQDTHSCCREKGMMTTQLSMVVAHSQSAASSRLDLQLVCICQVFRLHDDHV